MSKILGYMLHKNFINNNIVFPILRKIQSVDYNIRIKLDMDIFRNIERISGSPNSDLCEMCKRATIIKIVKNE